MLDFFRNKKIFVTGHTGFKGSWMCRVLCKTGAKIYGYALDSPTTPNLYKLCGIENQMISIVGDIRDLNYLQKTFSDIKPDIVIHMAAQPLVRESYENPVYTYDVNVMGTVNVLECIRKTNSVKSFLNITTDKVYRNREWNWGYRENEELNGYDPYSNSKSCSELVTGSYKKSFFTECGPAISTMRAGNVIGGGDFAKDRIIPDCVKAANAGKEIVVRNPFSVRPYQHVLDPIMAYLLVAKAQYENPTLAGSYNVGPNDYDCRTTGELVTLFCNEWNRSNETKISWVNQYDGGPHEATFLKLDCAKIKNTFHWKPVWRLEQAMERIVEWNQVHRNGEDIAACMDRQIDAFIDMADWM